ncbi:MAG: B12-binding domain-containing radical SAM protein [candidate division Zixibacteria bacterium]|nr:B12-binding domain-containing radical SAM protein [candidate division Zixibacteria bacterium]
MKVQLIIPPISKEFYPVSRSSFFPPLGLLSIATYLKTQLPEINVEILDGNILPQKSIEARINGDFVGISPTILSYENGLRIARISKERGAVVVFGGFYATALGEKILRNREYLDFIVIGDGEIAFSKLVQGEFFASIDNLIYRDGEDIKRTNQRLLNLDSLPFVNHGLLDERIYAINFQKKYAKEQFKIPNIIYSQKDCMWSTKTGGCVFCGRIDRDWRGRTPKRVWEEILLLNRQYKTDYVWDVSGSFVGNRDWLKEFYFSRPKNIPVVFEIYARASEINQETAKMLHELNCYKVFIGIDSGDPITLKSARKGSSVKKNIQAVELLNKYGICLALGFVVGLPGETYQTIKNTYEHANLLCTLANVETISCSSLIPIPGSKSFDMMLKHPYLPLKYKSQDVFNVLEMECDWTNNFCHIDYETASHYINKILSLAPVKSSMGKINRKVESTDCFDNQEILDCHYTESVLQT